MEMREFFQQVWKVLSLLWNCQCFKIAVFVLTVFSSAFKNRAEQTKPCSFD